MTEQSLRSAAEQAAEALEPALNGLRWYRDSFPDTVGETDDEIDAQIESAIAALRAALAAEAVAAPVQEPVTRQGIHDEIVRQVCHEYYSPPLHGAAPCTVCGVLPFNHGSYPTCSTHPYTPDGKCRAVLGAACVGSECANGCVRNRASAPAALPQPLSDEQIDDIKFPLDLTDWTVHDLAMALRKFARAIEAAHGIAQPPQPQLSPGQAAALERQKRLCATLPQTREQVERLTPHQEVRAIVNGHPRTIYIKPSATLRALVIQALTEAKVQDFDLDRWEIFDAEGHVLKQEYAVSTLLPGEVFINRAAGVGG